MPSDRRHRISALAMRLCDLPPDEWRAVLDAECAGDPELAREAESWARALQADEGLPSGNVAEIAYGNSMAAREQVGPYHIVRMLGHGAMGEVYLAEKQGEGFAPVQRAVKVIRGVRSNPALRRGLQREQASLERLSRHPNIVKITDADLTDQDEPYLVLELLDRPQSLTSWCTLKKLDVRARLRLFVTLSDAIRYAHALEVTHGDLKPGNVLMTEDGTLKVLDFGLSRLVESSGGWPASGQGTTPGGTLQYMSPEQAQGAKATAASDVWALGMILYELLAGEPPYHVSSVEELIQVHGQHPLSPSLPERFTGSGGERWRAELNFILCRALASGEVARCSAGELRSLVQSLLEDRPVMGFPARPWYPLGKLIRRKPLASTLGALAFIGLVMAAIQWPRAEKQRALAEHRLAVSRARLAVEKARGMLEDGAVDTAMLVAYHGWTRLTALGERRDDPSALGTIFLSLERTARPAGVIRIADTISEVVINQAGTLAAAVPFSGPVSLHSLADGALLGRVEMGDSAHLWSFGESGEAFAVADRSGKVQLFHVPRRKVTRVESYPAGLQAVAVRGQDLITADAEGIVRRNGVVVLRGKALGFAVPRVGLDPTGRRAALCDASKPSVGAGLRVIVVDLDNGAATPLNLSSLRNEKVDGKVELDWKSSDWLLLSFVQIAAKLPLAAFNTCPHQRGNAPARAVNLRGSWEPKVAGAVLLNRTLGEVFRVDAHGDSTNPTKLRNLGSAIEPGPWDWIFSFQNDNVRWSLADPRCPIVFSLHLPGGHAHHGVGGNGQIVWWAESNEIRWVRFGKAESRATVWGPAGGHVAFLRSGPGEICTVPDQQCRPISPAYTELTEPAFSEDERWFAMLRSPDWVSVYSTDPGSRTETGFVVPDPANPRRPPGADLITWLAFHPTDPSRVTVFQRTFGIGRDCLIRQWSLTESRWVASLYLDRCTVGTVKGAGLAYASGQELTFLDADLRNPRTVAKLPGYILMLSSRKTPGSILVHYSAPDGNDICRVPIARDGTWLGSPECDRHESYAEPPADLDFGSGARDTDGSSVINDRRTQVRVGTVKGDVSWGDPRGHWASGGLEQTGHLLPTSYSKVGEAVCRAAGRNLRRDEWAKVFPQEAYEAVCPALPVEPAESQRR